MAKSPLAKLAAQLRSHGFDRSSVDRGRETVRVACSQCAAYVISGHAVHESGCPNEKKAKQDDDD